VLPRSADLRRILGAARTTLRLPLFDRPPIPAMGAGRLALLGDAAHPMLPFFAQGASQAIEDAWILARCLKGVDSSDIPAALRRYEAARSGRTASVQAKSIRNGRLFTLPDGLRQWARDLALRRLSLQSFSWLYGYDVLHAPI
jgi:salicylate hydroxylase